MKILTECCLTHCILHHHYLVNKTALFLLFFFRSCKVSIYLEKNLNFNKGFLTESFSMMFYLKRFVLYFFDNL